jgi:RHS repeat-associated protein
MKPTSMEMTGAILVAVLLAAPVGAQSAAPTPPPPPDEEVTIGLDDPGPIPAPGPMPVSTDSPALYHFDLGYAPNGAIASSQDSVNGNWLYSYDGLDRLSRAAGRGTFTYDYDRNGNRWRQNSLDGQGPSRQYGIDASNNRLSGMAYDALGNVVHDGTHSYTYDAENRLIRVDGGATAQYAYDAVGRRVRKSTSAGAAEYLFDLDGHPIASRDPATGTWPSREVYAGARHLATYARGTTYLHHQDWLGSHRLTTLFDGTVTEKCMDLPFGDGLDCSQASGQPATSTPFADYERDRETQLDHTWFRQYSSAQGRWTTPDPYLGSIDTSNPQSLNRYSYVLNDPVGLRDPLGLMAYMGCVWDDGTFDDSEEDGGASQDECAAQGGTWAMIDTGNSIDVIGTYPRVDPVLPSWLWGPIPFLPIGGSGGSRPGQTSPQKEAPRPCSLKPPPPPRLDAFELSHLQLQALMNPAPRETTISAAPKPGEEGSPRWDRQLAQIPVCMFSMFNPVVITGAGNDTLFAWGCDEIERNPHAEYGREAPRGPENILEVTPGGRPCPVPE